MILMVTCEVVFGKINGGRYIKVAAMFSERILSRAITRGVLDACKHVKALRGAYLVSLHQTSRDQK